MRAEFEKIAYDLSLIYAQEKLRQVLANEPIDFDNFAIKNSQIDFLKKEFAFALDMYLNRTDESFLEDFDYAFTSKV